MVTSKNKNRKNGAGWQSEYALAIIVGLSAVVYMWLFFIQPLTDLLDYSRLTFVVTRLLLVEQIFGETTGGLNIGVLDRLPVFLGTMAWLYLAWLIGHALVDRAFASTQLRRIEMISLSVLAGLALLSTLTLLVGLMGGSGSRWPLALGVTLVLVVCNLRNLPKWNALQAPTASETIFASSMATQIAKRMVIVCTVMLGIAYLLGAMLPPIEFDVLEYHLQAPKEFYQLGRIGFNDHNIYANMPLGLEMHSLSAMSLIGGQDSWWLGGLIGKTVIGVHSIIGATLIGGFVARRRGAFAGWCAAGLLLASPGNVQVATAGLIDAAMATYILATAIVLAEFTRSVETGPSDARDHKSDRLELNSRKAWRALLVGVFAGGAAAAKYPALIYAVLPAVLAMLWLIYRNQDRLQLVRCSLLFLAGLVLTCVPWYGKNFAATGNPFFPLAYKVFGGEGLNDQHAQQWAEAHRVPRVNGLSPYSLKAAYRSCWNVTMTSPILLPSLMVLLIGGLTGAWRVRRSWQWYWFAWTLWILAVWWFATHRIDRFWLPVLPLWSAVAAVGVSWTAQRAHAGLAIALVFLSMVYGLLVGTSPLIGDTRYFASLAELRSYAILDKANIQEIDFPAISRALKWCNDNLTPENKVLLIGEARPFEFRCSVAYATCFDDNPGEAWLKDLPADQQSANLKTNQVTHLLINWNEIDRYRQPGNYGFSSWPQPSDIAELKRRRIVQSVSGWHLQNAGIELLEVLSP